MTEIGKVYAISKYVCAKCGKTVSYFDLWETEDGVKMCEEHFKQWEHEGYSMFFEQEVAND